MRVALPCGHQVEVARQEREERRKVKVMEDRRRDELLAKEREVSKRLSSLGVGVSPAVGVGGTGRACVGRYEWREEKRGSSRLIIDRGEAEGHQRAGKEREVG